MRIAAVGASLPPHTYDQEALIGAFESLWGRVHHNADRVRRLHEAVSVRTRALALPMEGYAALRGFGDANDAFLDVGVQLGEQALGEALQRAGLQPSELDAIWSTTVTGIAAPSLDARLVHRMGLRPDIRRTPMFGLGCVAGVAGIARMYDVIRGRPEAVGALLSVELCSLTLQRSDLSVANLVATGLFGDGAAAVIAIGEHRARELGLDGAPRVVATASRLYPDSERVMGWDVGDGGLKIVLDRSVPQMVRRYLREDVEALLGDHGLGIADIDRWICHPGGPAVIDAVVEVLGLEEGDVEVTRRSLEAVGNLSSASVLFVLQEVLAQAPPEGSWGLMVAFGPGFCSELALLRW